MTVIRSSVRKDENCYHVPGGIGLMTSFLIQDHYVTYTLKKREAV